MDNVWTVTPAWEARSRLTLPTRGAIRPPSLRADRSTGSGEYQVRREAEPAGDPAPGAESGDHLGAADVNQPRHGSVKFARFQGAVANAVEDGAEAVPVEELPEAGAGEDETTGVALDEGGGGAAEKVRTTSAPIPVVSGP